MKLVPVNDHPDLVRDLKTGAILSTNTFEIEKARERKEKRKKEKEEIDRLKDDVKEIRDLLSVLLQKIGDQWPEK